MGPPGEILVYWPWFVTAVTMELSGIALGVYNFGNLLPFHHAPSSVFE